MEGRLEAYFLGSIYMKHLKKDMVKRVIELARECPPTRDFTAEEIALGVKGKLPTDPASMAFNQYLKEIGSQAVAELTALMWLGQDLHRKSEEWPQLVATATEQRPFDAQTVSKAKLGPYLRAGMERLARANKQQQQRTAEPSRVVVAQSPPPAPLAAPTPAKVIKAATPSLNTAEARRAALVGAFVLASYRSRYGAKALPELGQLMQQAGFLEECDRPLFAAETVAYLDRLEVVLGK